MTPFHSDLDNLLISFINETEHSLILRCDIAAPSFFSPGHISCDLFSEEHTLKNTELYPEVALEKSIHLYFIKTLLICIK